MTDPRLTLLHVHIAAGYPSVRAGLMALLGMEAGISAEPMPDASETLDQTCPVSPLPTVIVADIGSLADSALEDVLYRNPAAPILLLGGHPGSDGPGLRRGPAGYLPPDADGPTIAAAARAVAMGLSVVDPSLLGVGDLPAPEPVAVEGEPLTPREREGLDLVADGLPSPSPTPCTPTRRWKARHAPRWTCPTCDCSRPWSTATWSGCWSAPSWCSPTAAASRRRPPRWASRCWCCAIRRRPRRRTHRAGDRGFSSLVAAARQFRTARKFP